MGLFQTTLSAAVAVGIVDVAATLVGQSAAPSIAPYVDAGGSAALVAAIIYIAKKVSNGDLVARPVADLARQAEIREERLAELHRNLEAETQRTIDKLMDIINESKSREDALRMLLIQQHIPPGHKP